MHLWEVNHPYYMNEGCYYETGCHEEFESLDTFLDHWADADIDMNRVHRWDWREGEDWGVTTPKDDPDVRGELLLFYVMQRKARLLSCSVSVKRSDEPRVMAFLQPHMNLNAAIWHPLTPTKD